MLRRYITLDVFTTRRYGGNPLAVVLDAAGLSTQDLQAIAAEFNYSETTFILPPADPAHTAHVRIFTPRIEVPFAGHPNVGTAVALAAHFASEGRPVGDHFVFEEAAGLVPLRLIRSGSEVVGAELRAPQALSIGATVPVADAGECLSLPADDLLTRAHPPQVMSVGLAFLVVELASRDALRRARPVLASHERVLPPVGVDGVLAYWREPTGHHLHARVFAPLDACLEDPATGSAAAAIIARLATLGPAEHETIAWRVDQGEDMGRPSLILGRTETRAGRLEAVHIAGHAVPVMSGTLRAPAA